MQTFLPYPEFGWSAAVLDQRRLGKQRVETLQVLQALLRGTRWRNHPAVRMWAGYEEALTAYGLVVCRTWTSLGFADTCAAKYLTELGVAGLPAATGGVRDQAALAAAGALPPWLGDPALHRSHRSSLLRKDPEWYGRFFPDTPNDLPYHWPVPGGAAS